MAWRRREPPTHRRKTDDALRLPDKRKSWITKPLSEWK
jgi:hypothetical protein